MSDLTKLNFNGEINKFTDEIARGLIGNVEDLQTEAKDSLVNALNEVDDKSSGLNDEVDGIKRRLTSAEENIVHVTSEIGEMNQLKTTDKSTMVGAINEIFDRSDESVIGDLSDLTTTEKSTLVGAINEVNLNVTDAVSDVGTLETAVGDLADLDTSDKSSIVNAINEVAGNASDERIGDLNDLTTTEKSTVVGAINEVNSNVTDALSDIGTLETAVGDLADLDTTDKTSVVGAVNEANTKAENAQDDVDALETAVGDLADLDTTDKTSIVNAINEVAGNASDERIGDLNDLTTTEKSTVVDAINEVDANAENAQDDVDALETAVGDLADLNTTDKTNIVDAINEVNSNTGAVIEVLASVTGDGVTTGDVLLTSLYTQLVNRLPNFYEKTRLLLRSTSATNDNYGYSILNQATRNSVDFGGSYVMSSTQVGMQNMHCSNNPTWAMCTFTNNGVTITDLGAIAINSGLKFEIISY